MTNFPAIRCNPSKNAASISNLYYYFNGQQWLLPQYYDNYYDDHYDDYCDDYYDDYYD